MFDIKIGIPMCVYIVDTFDGSVKVCYIQVSLYLYISDNHAKRVYGGKINIISFDQIEIMNGVCVCVL